MNKYLWTSIITAGVAICVFAPIVWRLVGVFCIGGGCYVIIEALKLSSIQREVERYERPTAHVLRSPQAEWKSVRRRPVIKTQGQSFHLQRGSANGMSRRVTALARIFMYTIGTFA